MRYFTLASPRGEPNVLNVLRKSFKEQPYLKWLLVVVAASFILYLGSFFTGTDAAESDSWAARVNDEEISTREVQNAARRLDQYYRQLLGPTYDQHREQLQINSQALQTLVEERVMRQDARRMGLHVSKADVADYIRADPNLRDETGQFIGLERYRQVVGQGYPGGIPAYEQLVADQLLVSKWTQLITQPVDVSDEELKELFRRSSEKTSVAYVVLPSAEQEVDRDVTDAELRTWYDGHQEAYRREEGRRIRYVVASRDEQRGKVQLTDEQVRAAYEANQDSYSHPEQRRARHILLRLEPDASDEEKQRLRQRAEALLQRLRNGEDFESLARSESKDPASSERGGDLGFFARGQMVPPFEEAAFNTPVGQLAPVVESPFGLHVIQVTDQRAAGILPLQEVEADIRRSQELAQAQQLAEGVARRLREEIGSAEQLQSVADREKLTVQSAFLLRKGGAATLGASNEVVEQVFALAPGSVSAPLPMRAGVGLVVVDEAVPPAVAPFEEVREQVKDDLLSQRSRDMALATARRTLAQTRTVAEAARQLGLEAHTADNLVPGQDLPHAGGPAPDLQLRLFGERVQVGDRGVEPVRSGAVLYEVTAHQPFDPARFEAEKTTLREQTLAQRREQYRQAVLAQLRQRQEIEFNHRLVDRLRG
jgi:peptidyl-prolyl cis-trans isomerase D